jgi:hypothetical protein
MSALQVAMFWRNWQPSGQAALSAAFDDPAVRDLLVFNLGDGGAMSGVLFAARRVNGEATFLVFLMD